MRIATWNVNGLRARMDFIAHWLKSREPDVVGLQEVKVTDDDFPHDDFQALGYHAVVHGEKSWNGVAVLSRTPAEVETRGLPGRENDGARLLRGAGRRPPLRHGVLPQRQDPRPSRLPLEARVVRSATRLPRRRRPGCRVRHRRRFQHRAGGAGLLAGRRRRRFVLLHHRGAIPVPVPPRSGAHGPVSPPVPGGAEVLLVGLPGRVLSPRPGAAHRPAPGYPPPWSRGCAAWRSIASTARRRKATRRPITRRCSRIWIDRPGSERRASC